MAYTDILKQIIPIARQAGAILRQQFDQPHQQATKSSAIDLVTETDEQAETLITEQLLHHFPEHHLVGEEGGGQGAPHDQAEYLWFIDPIDGTTNFASGIPHFCTSIALTDRQRQTLVGVIYDPMRDELYTAARGHGAYLNDKALQVTTTATLQQAVLASGFAYDKHSNPDNNAAQWRAFMTQVRGVRRMGSAALDLAYVAAGRYDGYWERSLQPWDALAGVLLVTEAGGTVSDYGGGDQPQFDADGRYVASNGHLHAHMLDVLQTSYA